MTSDKHVSRKAYQPRGFASAVSALSQREIPKGGVCGRSRREQTIGGERERERKVGQVSLSLRRRERAGGEKESGRARDGKGWLRTRARTPKFVRPIEGRTGHQTDPVLCCACEGGKSVKRFGDGKRRITRGMPIARQTHFHVARCVQKTSCR